MAKKSLGDLLREEAQKTLETQNGQESVVEESAVPVVAVDEDTSADFLEPDEPSSVQELPLEMTASETTSAFHARRSRTTKAELETTISELRKVIQKAGRHEKSLQQQITDLQSELQEQKILVQKLQADLAKSDQLKTELEQAKKMILQLSEANSKKSEKVDNSDKGNQSLRIQKLPLKKSGYPLIQTTSPSTALSNEDVGWVD